MGLAVPRPKRNEMKPLIEMFTDKGFKGIHNALGQLLASGALAKRRTVIVNRWQDVRVVGLAVASEVNGQENTTGSTGQFGRGDRGWERFAKELHHDRAGRGWAVHQEGNGDSGLETLDYFEEGEGVAADDQSLDIPASA